VIVRKTILYLERSFWRSGFVQDLEVDCDHVLANAVLGDDSVGSLVRPTVQGYFKGTLIAIYLKYP
jgi:hypothetical protein